MQISDSHLQEATLAGFGAEAVRLLRSSDFPHLAAQFGYAVALGRDTALAIREDMLAGLANLGANGLDPRRGHTAAVTYFKANDAGLLASVECLVPTNNGLALLLELVVSAEGETKHVTLEQLSAAA
ncbi:hypothetical protein ACFQME_05030 [Luteimonas weifangensis]